MERIYIRALLLIAYIIVFGCNAAKKASGNATTIPPKYDKIYTDVQRTTFQYFWDGAEPTSGLQENAFM